MLTNLQTGIDSVRILNLMPILTLSFRDHMILDKELIGVIFFFFNSRSASLSSSLFLQLLSLYLFSSFLISLHMPLCSSPSPLFYYFQHFDLSFPSSSLLHTAPVASVWPPLIIRVPWCLLFSTSCCKASVVLHLLTSAR